MAEPEYQRLTRARPRSVIAPTGNSSLWLGPDHLLCIDTNGYTETYKRFHFRDIQAIIARRSHRRMWLNVMIGLFSLFPLLVLIFGSPSASISGWSNGDVIRAIVMGVTFVFFLLLMLVNHLKGPGCVCYLRTAVQTEELPSITRIQRLNKVLDRIQPLIVYAQGELAREEIPARMRQLADAPAHNYVVDDPNLPPRIL